MILLKNVQETPNPPDELAQNISNKSLSFESSESCRVFNYLHDSISIFRAAGIISEKFIGRTVPLFVGGVICLVNSVNGRDHCLLYNVKYVSFLNTSFRDVLCLTQGSFKQ